jgi:hypothetical protein
MQNRCITCGQRLSALNRGETCFHHPTGAMWNESPVRKHGVNLEPETRKALRQWVRKKMGLPWERIVRKPGSVLSSTHDPEVHRARLVVSCVLYNHVGLPLRAIGAELGLGSNQIGVYLRRNPYKHTTREVVEQLAQFIGYGERRRHD